MKEYFLIGIKGKGMQALAKYLCLEGNKVEGYDDNKEKDNVYHELENIGIKILSFTTLHYFDTFYNYNYCIFL